MNLVPTLIALLHFVGNSSAFTMPNHTNFFRSTSQLMQSADDETIGNINGDRRRFMEIVSSAAIVGTTSTFFPSPSLAAEDDAFTLFKDENIGFQIKAPSGWDKSEQTLPDRRRLVLFMNNEDGSAASKNDLMFIAYTPIRDDFTALSSMGTLDQVGQTTIMPKGELMGQEQDSKMLAMESKNNAYFYDYVSKVPGQPKRHFRTIFSLAQGATGGAGAVLVSITTQTTSDRYDGLKDTFDEIINSYGKLKK